MPIDRKLARCVQGLRDRPQAGVKARRQRYARKYAVADNGRREGQGPDRVAPPGWVDEAFFLGGVSKDKVLQAFGAHIFFDDQDVHCQSAAKVVPTARVLAMAVEPKPVQVALTVDGGKPHRAVS
jgi:hypothetical protein